MGFLVLALSGVAFAEGRYKDNGNGTITDSKTNLMWQQQDDGNEMMWRDAINYCENLKLGGQGKWRLPSKDELESLVNNQLIPMIDPIFTGTKSSNYWSSTTDASSTSSAWVVAFSGGGGAYNDVKAYGYYVRCVR